MSKLKFAVVFSIIFFGVLFFAKNSLAASVTVCDSGCNYTSIGAALAGIGNGNHTITVQTPYTNEGNVTCSRSGTSAALPLTITGKAGNTVSVSGFYITGSNVVLNNFTITAATAGSYGASVETTGNNNTISNNKFTEQDSSAVATILAWGGGSTADNVTISGNLFTNSHGLNSNSPVIYALLTNSLVENNEYYLVTHDFIRPWGHDITIRGNYIHGGGSLADPDHADFVQIYYAGDPGESTSYNIIIERNFVSDVYQQICNLSNDSTPGTINNYIFRNNIFTNVRFAANIGIRYVSFYNNVFYNCNSYNNDHPLLFMGTGGVLDGRDGIVKNNIFINSSNSYVGWYAGDSLVTADYNYVASLSTYTAKSGFSETHGVNGGNPYFMNAGGTSATDYQLTSNSTNLINKGTIISGFSTDYDRTTRPQGSAWDIGAYEYVQAGDTTPPSAPTGVKVG